MSAGNAPKGLSAQMINNWFSGMTKNAKSEHVEYVLEVMQDHCAAIGGLEGFTPKMREALERERQRTGVLQGKLFESLKHIPDGLRVATVTRWINNPPTKVRKDHYEFVLGAWKALPDQE